MNNEKMTFREMVFRELRTYVSEEHRERSIFPAAAVTLNENLRAYGFIMDADGTAEVAKNLTPEQMKEMQNDIAEFAGKVKAEPMYPGFPQEVLDISEAQYRYDQLRHYFSTYGAESLTGCEVRKGWLPHGKDEKKKEKEEKEFNGFMAGLKRISVAFGDDAYIVPLETILSRRQRMTEIERMIVSEAVRHAPEKKLPLLRVPFKENILPVFEIAMSEGSAALAECACQHTGDVIKCLGAFLRKRHYRITTSQKRLAARIIESYQPMDFRENICISEKKAIEAENIMRAISFTRFARSAAHIQVLNDLRDGKLRSWTSEIEQLLASRSPEALERIAERPGMMLRMTRRLIGLGYPEGDIMEALCQKADRLSTASLVAAIESTDLSEVLVPALKKRLAYADTPLEGKKVFLDEQGYDLANSRIGRSEEGGYVRSGMAFRIPDSAKRIRFFVYWNDSRRVDLDLHASVLDRKGDMHHVGWNGSFRKLNVVMSGDITHSDAAEYIDIDMAQSDVRRAYLSINLFSGKSSFADVEETLAGIMGIEKFGVDIAHYDPRSCFVSDRLVSKRRWIGHSIVDVENRFIRVERIPSGSQYEYSRMEEYGKTENPKLSVMDYVKMLTEAQNAELVSSEEEADIVLSTAKGGDASLIDENFFLDA